MKIIKKSIILLITIIISASCAKEVMIPVDPGFILSYERDGKTDAYAGNTFYVFPTGSGEFLTLFDGTKGHVWGETGAKGTAFNKADSLGVLYNAGGKYILSLVSTSTGNLGKEVSREVKSMEINVLDDRNSFTLFNIVVDKDVVTGVNGVISSDNLISFSVPDVVTDFKFKVTFVLDSDTAKAYVNGVEQVSNVTVNDFAQPVVYTVKSSLGTEKLYTVKFTTFPSSGEKMITKFSLIKGGVGGNGEIGVVDETNKIINLTANYATILTSVKLKLESSYASKIYLNNKLYSSRSIYNLSATGIKTIKVVAQDNSEVIYTMNTVVDSPVKSFTFAGLVPAPLGVIDDVAKTVTVDVFTGTDVTKLAAIWTGSLGQVKIGNVVQKNGATVNNFSTPLTYKFAKGPNNIPGDSYVVTVNVR